MAVPSPSIAGYDPISIPILSRVRNRIRLAQYFSQHARALRAHNPKLLELKAKFEKEGALEKARDILLDLQWPDSPGVTIYDVDNPDVICIYGSWSNVRTLKKHIQDHCDKNNIDAEFLF